MYIIPFINKDDDSDDGYDVDEKREKNTTFYTYIILEQNSPFGFS